VPAELTELKVRDVAIKLHRAGRGPTALFLHGAGGVPQWLPFFDLLAERHELLVPEHPPGCGRIPRENKAMGLIVLLVVLVLLFGGGGFITGLHTIIMVVA
jgi:pimeloyl-ACP methyl ester carboxylesterase